MMMLRRGIHTARRGCTFHYQASMPKLPIPKLEDTCNRWLAAVTPIMSPTELVATTEAIKSFATSERARFLQETLVQRDEAAPDNSYINDYWKDMYLRDMRQPLPLNVNPFLKLVDDERTNDQCERAASLVASSVRFLLALRNETLEPDIFHVGQIAQKPIFKNMVTFVPKSLAYYAAYFMKSYPLDMSQYPWLFCTSRQAFPGRDVLYTAPGSRHIVVLSGNLVYSLDVIAADGSPVAQSDILFALNEIRSGAKCSSLGVGSLTALSRDDWAKARPRLVETGDNKRLLERLESAVLALCLDEREVGESAATSAQVFLHGRHNRWYDKSLQLIVSSDGKAAVNFEHSWGDGVSVLRYANEICEDSFENQVSKIHKDRKGNNNIKPQLLDFNLSSVQTELVIADEWLKQKGESLTAAELRVNGFGKSFFKSRKIAPDGVVQNAIQLAYKRAFGSTVATYESASTAGFRKGRTETIRPATIESQAFVLAESTKEQQTKLRIAAEAHRRNSMNAAVGQGMDRHLFALRKIAEEDKTQPTPSIFTDPSFARMSHNVLSTSTLVSPWLDGGGFGPVVEDGFGIGYGTTDDRIAFSVTTYRKDMKLMLEQLDESLKIIKKLLD